MLTRAFRGRPLRVVLALVGVAAAAACGQANQASSSGSKKTTHAATTSTGASTGMGGASTGSTGAGGTGVGGAAATTATGSTSSSPTTSVTGTTTTATTTATTVTTGPGGPIGPGGGTIGTLSFAIVGDTRPPSDDDTGNYPTAVITKIWQDVQAFSPLPAFAISTGDYMFASPGNGQAGPQLDIYLGARAAFQNIVFPCMGNHECTGQTPSNCGAGNADGITDNINQFTAKMLAPINQTLPYYSVNINGVGNAWTAKLVYIAANYWSSAQASWLTSALQVPTTYTFVVRHEQSNSFTPPPGVAGSDPILSQYPYTQLITGHTHKYEHFGKEKLIVVGNGGAPLVAGSNYGYVIAIQQGDGSIQFTSYDYDTNAQNDQFAVQADGTCVSGTCF